MNKTMSFAAGAKQPCVYCYRDKPGRLLDKRWACYDCKPDTIDVSVVPSGAYNKALSAVTIARIKKDGISLVTPLQEEIQGLVIQSPEDYEGADALLTRVREARRRWSGKLAPILDPLAETVKFAKKAMDGAKAHFLEADKPLEQMELSIRAKMKDYKLEEVRLQNIAIQEQRRLQQAIDRAAEAEAAAATASQRRRLTATREALEKQSDAVADETPAQARVEGSTTRTKPNWRIKYLSQFLVAVADGTLPAECVTINTVEMNRQFKLDPEGMKAWPGVEIFEDVIIVGR